MGLEFLLPEETLDTLSIPFDGVIILFCNNIEFLEPFEFKDCFESEGCRR